MFTGIITEMGTVRSVRRIPGGLRLTVSADRTLEGMKTGDSIALDGVCQTVVAVDRDGFTVEVLPETLKRTTLGGLRPGRRINLEPAVGLDDRFGGHLITGHVDGLGTIRARRPRTGDTLLRIAAPDGIMTRMVERGSVAVDGISLTVVSLLREAFTVALIPHTLQATTLVRKRVGQRVNLESDLIVKAVQRLLDPALGRGRLTEKRLRELGF
jgi:riboflavin synthase